MLKEQGQKNIKHTEQIINILLKQDHKELRQKYCPLSRTGDSRASDFPDLFTIDGGFECPETSSLRDMKFTDKPEWPSNYSELIIYINKLENRRK